MYSIKSILLFWGDCMREVSTLLGPLHCRVEAIKFNNIGSLYELTNQLLKRGIHNDRVFEEYCFYMRVTVRDHIDVLYRILWEQLYLRINRNSRYVGHNQMVLRITLSEALAYIYDVTPPILQHKIPESIRSIEDIHTLLCGFLTDKTDINYNYQVSAFTKRIRLEPFETQWTYDTTRLLNMRCLLAHSNIPIVGVVDAMTFSMDSLMKIAKLDAVKGYQDQMMHVTVCVEHPFDESIIQTFMDFMDQGGYFTNVAILDSLPYVQLFFSPPSIRMIQLLAHEYQIALNGSMIPEKE